MKLNLFKSTLLAGLLFIALGALFASTSKPVTILKVVSQIATGSLCDYGIRRSMDLVGGSQFGRG